MLTHKRAHLCLASYNLRCITHELASDESGATHDDTMQGSNTKIAAFLPAIHRSRRKARFA